MKVLLDTHILLWWLVDTHQIKKEAREIISLVENPVYVSAASFWELAIKKSLGKIDIPDDLHSIMHSEHFLELPITPLHAWATKDLPLHHRDPFDRILIAQAQTEKIPILTRDSIFSKYNVHLIHA